MRFVVFEITPSLLDDLVYEAQQYDSTHVASLGISTAVVPTGDLNMHINRDNQEKQPNLNGLLEKKKPEFTPAPLRTRSRTRRRLSSPVDHTELYSKPACTIIDSSGSEPSDR
jgi:hypothetical protein